jgi:hypothetical protein
MRKFYTLEEIRALRKYWMAAKLEGPFAMKYASDQKWQQVCNGTGPDSWPNVMRHFVSFFREHKRGATASHDFRYEWSDGTKEGFKIANREYYANARKEVNYNFPLWKVWRLAHRINEIRQCYTDYALLMEFGWDAWVAAGKKNQKNNPQKPIEPLLTEQ